MDARLVPGTVRCMVTPGTLALPAWPVVYAGAGSCTAGALAACPAAGIWVGAGACPGTVAAGAGTATGAGACPGSVGVDASDGASGSLARWIGS